MRKPILFVCFVLAGCSFLVNTSLSQEIEPSKAVTVHLYRTGSGMTGIETYLDGKEIVKLHEHRIITVYLQPGYHELSVNFPKQQPTVALRSKAGDEYFIQLRVDVSRTALFLTNHPANAVQVSLTKENGIAERDKMREEKLNSSEIAAIFNMSKASGMEPTMQSAITTPRRVVPLLTDEEVQDAILNGIHNDSPNSVGLYLNDVQANFASHALADGEYANSGFSVIIFTPKRWIEYHAALAHRLMKPFNLADVTPEMRQKVLRVVALPRVPDRLDGSGMSAASSVARVVISDKSKEDVVQPLNEEPSQLTFDSALRSKDYTSIASTFDMEDVDRIREHDKGLEFYAIVIGEDGSRKFFNVKSKYSGWL